MTSFPSGRRRGKGIGARRGDVSGRRAQPLPQAWRSLAEGEMAAGAAAPQPAPQRDPRGLRGLGAAPGGEASGGAAAGPARALLEASGGRCLPLRGPVQSSPGGGSLA